ncbi:CrcB family protein [Corynebacterium sp. 320]|uniref:fluoride efflux transporter FluC n=1 Tax=Corynebacterium TaxID=1716 RepID=UPI00125CB4EE|nr:MULTISPECIES: CrcB family protein [Corynebacterium]KAB1502767.1 CrcB family protein [Corynebacterium sp. 320]KAB1550492.1 CrcB family protein [Corynebacterium sp. 319]KAB1554777.1 CrcB family protein [Corynebacterium sp. 321]KAB3526430.1 CrcB family protein [Corynebacterium sp. 250]KAB3539749.1 CrcB family protein [Corynebacterium sp. 366]
MNHGTRRADTSSSARRCSVRSRAHCPVPLVVFLGGTLGSCTHWLFQELLPDAWDNNGLTLLLINILGAFMLALINVFFIRRPASSPPAFRPFLTTGFLGAFTSFSALSAQSWAATVAHPAHASSSEQAGVFRSLEGWAGEWLGESAWSAVSVAAMMGGSIVLGLGAAVLGVVCGRALWGKSAR